jgi:hypothetical protein
MSINTMKFLKKITGEELNFANMVHSLHLADEVSQVELVDMIGISKGIMCDIEKDEGFQQSIKQKIWTKLLATLFKVL